MCIGILQKQTAKSITEIILNVIEKNEAHFERKICLPFTMILFRPLRKRLKIICNFEYILKNDEQLMVH